MAQSVEKLPSEDSSASAIVNSSIENTASSIENNTGGIFDFYNRSCNAFLCGSRLERPLYSGLLLGLFGLLNYFLSKFIITLSYFASINPQLSRFCSILFGVLAIPYAYFALRTNFTLALRDLKRKMISASVCQSLAVIISAAFLAYVLIFDLNLLMKSNIERNFISLIFLLSLANYLEERIFRRVMLKTGYDMTLLSGEVKPAGFDESGPGKVAFNKVNIGDVLEAGVEDLVAFDGIVVDGQAQVLETIYTAKGVPRLVQNPDRIYSGSKILRGKIVYKVSALNPDSAISDFSNIINRRVLENSGERIQIFNSSQTICNLICIFFALAAGLFWLARFQSPQTAVSVATAILLISLTAKLLQLNLLMPVLTDTAAFYRGILFVKNQVLKSAGAIRRLVLDYSFKERGEVVNLIKFELIDKRVDEASLPSVLFALAGRGTGPESLAITNYITNKNYDLNLYPNQEYIEYFEAGDNSVRGFVGKVSGVDFTVGNEDFLLERGVLVQASELDDSEDIEPGCYFWYVALQREVIAYLLFSKDNPVEVRRELEKFKAEGFRATLCSRDDHKLIDELGQSLGFELADIYGGLNEDNYSKKLESLKPLALYFSGSFPADLKNKASLTISEFDELQFDLKKSDVLLFDAEFKSMFEAVLIPFRAQRIEQQNLFLATSLSLLLLGLSSMNLISPLVCLLAVTFASNGMLLNVLRLGRFDITY
jgi:cation transport ATPase